MTKPKIFCAPLKKNATVALKFCKNQEIYKTQTWKKEEIRGNFLYLYSNHLKNEREREEESKGNIILNQNNSFTSFILFTSIQCSLRLQSNKSVIV